LRILRSFAVLRCSAFGYAAPAAQDDSRALVILRLPEATETKAERRRTAKDLKMDKFELKPVFRSLALDDGKRVATHVCAS